MATGKDIFRFDHKLNMATRIVFIFLRFDHKLNMATRIVFCFVLIRFNMVPRKDTGF